MRKVYVAVIALAFGALFTGYVTEAVEEVSKTTVLLKPGQPAIAVIKAFEAFKQKYGTEWRLQCDFDTGVPIKISGSRTPSKSGDAETIATDLLPDILPIFQINSVKELEFVHVKHVMDVDHVRFRQLYKGMEVFGSALRIHIQNGSVHLIDGEIYPAITIESVTGSEKEVSMTQSQDIVLTDLANEKITKDKLKTTKIVYPHAGNYTLAWKTIITKPGGIDQIVIVHMNSGEIIFKGEDPLSSAPF